MDRNDNAKEEWKTYPLNNNYSVSSEGNILGPYRMLKPHIQTDKKGRSHAFVGIKFGKNEYAKKITIANIVATTFLPENKSIRPTVVFIDGDSLNYKLSNLRWKERQDYAKQGGIRN